MNKVLNKTFYIAFILTAIISFHWIINYSSRSDIYNNITFINILALTFYFIAIKTLLHYGERFSKSIFLLIVFTYTIFFGIIYVLSYYRYTGDFFDFQRGDTLAYHNEVLLHTDYSFKKFIQSLFKDNKWDDLGVTIYTFFLYKIIKSPLFIYFINIIAALITANLLYKLANLYLDRTKSSIVSVLYALSSYYIYFHVSLYKESIFILLCVATIYYGQIIISKNNINLIFPIILLLISLSLFRIGTPVLILSSYLLYIIFKSIHASKQNICILIFIIPAFFYFIYSIFLETYKQYINVEFLSYYVNASGYSYSFYNHLFISIFSALFGPIPSFMAVKEYEISSYYYAGYLIKYLLSPYFIIAVIQIFKNKMFNTYPLVFYYLIGSVVFGFALRGFDMRFLATHSFLFYLILFVGMENYKITTRFQKMYFFISYFILIITYFLFNNRF